MMEKANAKMKRLIMSKSQTNIGLNLSVQQCISQNCSRQKYPGTIMSPKDRVDKILNSLNMYKRGIGRKENQNNSSKISQIFNNSYNLSQYKEEKSFLFSTENVVDGRNLSKNNSKEVINLKNDHLNMKPSQFCKNIRQQANDKLNSYKLNRVLSSEVLEKYKHRKSQFLSNTQSKNILKSSSSQSNFILGVQQEKQNSLALIKQKLVKYGIKMNIKENMIQKNQQNKVKEQKQNQKIPSQNLNQNILTQSNSTNQLLRDNSKRKFTTVNIKQLTDKISQTKIGQPKLTASFKNNNNKNSQIVNPISIIQHQIKEKSFNHVTNQSHGNNKTLRKGTSMSSFLNIPQINMPSDKQNFDLKQTMQTNCTQPIKKQKLSVKDFILGKQIGKGKFGQVFLSLHAQTGFLCAMKIIKKQTIRKQRNLQQLIRQIKIQSFVNHSNTVKMYGFFDDSQNIYLLIEYCTDGQLYSQLKIKKKLNEDEAIPVIKDICEGLNCLHDEGIIHRDIKPENIVLSFGMGKLCDFGWSVNSQNEKRETFCGTPLYVSPQLLLGRSYDYKVDIWALGILSYQLLTGKLPFQIMSQKQLKKIVTNQVQYPDYMSENSKDFIKHLLHKNPSYRNDMETVLKHKFLTQGMQRLRNKNKKAGNN